MSELTMMNRDDMIWLAGLCEGEACVDLHKGKYPRLRIGMTDRDVVGRAATLMDCRVRLSMRPFPDAAMWHAEVSGTKAVSILTAILPHMGARRSAKIATVLGHAGLDGPGPRISRPPALPVAA